jgi:hypothetical protein
MMATMISPSTLPTTFLDSVPPRSLLLYPSLIDQTSLSDLEQLVRNRNYHLYRDAVTRIQLDQLILANALITRLASLLYYAQTLLVRLVVNHSPANDNTSDFTVLTQAAHELRKSITNKYTSSIEEGIRPPSSHRSAQPGHSSPRSFLDELSPTASTTLLTFLSSVRNDPTLISSRLLQATDHELDSLVSWKPHHHVARLKDSSASRQNSLSAPAISPGDYVMSFHRHDPLFVLTSVIYSAPHDSRSPDYQRRLNTWSSCLAQLIDAKRGDRVIFAVMDIWAGNEWQAASSFETVVLGFLQDAAKIKGGKEKYDVCDDEDGVDPEMAELFNRTLLEVLEILNGFGGVPASALEFVHAIFRRCQDKSQAKTILFTNWFIQHFMSQIILYPEVYPIYSFLMTVSRTSRRMLCER